MWYIEIDGETGWTPRAGMYFLQQVEPRLNNPDAVWVTYVRNDKRESRELPFKYDDFKTILTDAHKKGVAANFKENNWPALRRWLDLRSDKFKIIQRRPLSGPQLG